MGKKLIIANWKMNLNIHEASLFVHKLDDVIQTHRNVEVVIAPTLLALQSVSLQVDHRKLKLAAQNFYWRDQGAYTGEVSANQLRGLVQYGLVGHSERRHIFHENPREIRQKVQAAFRNQFVPVLCVGETASARADGETNATIHDHLIEGLSNITSEEAERLVIAYEPVWAIGTGDSATPEDVSSAVRVIRRQVSHLFGDSVAGKVRVLYGGSVSSDNARAYLLINGVDGLLVGSASLSVDKFEKIIETAHTSNKDEG